MALVLTVDDDPRIRAMIRTMLETAGHEVLEAEDGRAARDLIAGGAHPNLILLDATMPRLDGIGFARAYRRRPGPHAPIIVISALQELATFAAQAGAVDMLPKPFSAIALAQMVDQHAR